MTVLDDSRGFSPDRADLKKPLFILMGMAGLLVAMCAINVATLLLLRASARASEMSMRYALGAKRRPHCGAIAEEGGMLGLAGGSGGTCAGAGDGEYAGAADDQRRSGTGALLSID